MNTTVAGLVTPHLLRVVDLANQAETGVNVEWHLRDAVGNTMTELRDLWNAPALKAAYVEGLEAAVGRASGNRAGYVRVLQTALDLARGVERY